MRFAADGVKPDVVARCTRYSVTPTLSVEADQLSWAALIAPVAVNEPGAVGAALSTVTATPAEVRVLPAVSRATAVSVWLPFERVVVASDSEYGFDVSAAPKSVTSTLN